MCCYVCSIYSLIPKLLPAESVRSRNKDNVGVNIDPASSQVFQKLNFYILQIHWQNITEATSSCCLYILWLVPNTCGFCVTSRGKYPLTVRDIHNHEYSYAVAATKGKMPEPGTEVRSNQVSWTKISTCRNGPFKNQPNKMGMGPQYFHYLYCVILPTMSCY